MDIVTYALLNSKIKKISPSPYKYKGSVPTQEDLPASAELGDMYSVDETGFSYVWDGEKWVEISGGIALNEYVAEGYSSLETYKKGEYVVHENKLYRAKQDINAAEEWTSEHWQQIRIADDVRSAIPVQKDLTLGTNWTYDEGNRWTQTVTVSGYDVTENTKVDISAVYDTLDDLFDEGVDGMCIANTGGVLTAYVVGAKPTSAHTVTAILTEVK